MARRFPILLVIACVLLPLLAQSQGDPLRESLRRLTCSADSGNPSAMFRLARLYESGYDSIPADSLRAVALYRKAAEADYPPAQNYYGFMLYNGRMVPRNPALGLEWMEKAAMAGDASAANNLGWIILNDKNIKRNSADAAFWFRRAVDAGMPKAMSMLADLYRTGDGVPCDTLEAVTLYNGAIERGLTDAQPKLLSMMDSVWSCLPADSLVSVGRYYYTHRAPVIGVVLFEKAAREGNADAYALLGDALTRAQGADYDHDKALHNYYQAAHAGNPSAQFVVGELLEFFPDALEVLDYYDRIPDEERHADYWLTKAAAAGVRDASDATHHLLH